MNGNSGLTLATSGSRSSCGIAASARRVASIRWQPDVFHSAARRRRITSAPEEAVTYGRLTTLSR